MRISHLFSKLESQIKQILRERPMLDGEKLVYDESIIANLLLAYVEGRMSQFVRSQFEHKPTNNFKGQWTFFHRQLIATS